MDENSDLEHFEVAQETHVEIDLKGMTSVNSSGLRKWLTWAHAIEGVRLVTIENCPANFLHMAAVLKGMLPKHFDVRSVTLPYFCETCENTTHQKLEIKKRKAPSTVAPSLPCQKCKSNAELDIDPAVFFRFLEN